MKKYFLISTLLFFISCSSPKEKVSDFCNYIIKGDYGNASKCTERLDANSIQNDHTAMFNKKNGFVNFNILKEEISSNKDSAKVDVLYITGDGSSFNVTFKLKNDLSWKIISYSGYYTYY